MTNMVFLRFFLRRLLAIPMTLLVITAVLYGIIMLAPPEERAALYIPPHTRQNMPADLAAAHLQQIINENGLDDPYLVQYIRWLSRLVRGDWGYSPIINDSVLHALLQRTPVTAELTFYSILLLLPLGLIGGTLSGWYKNGRLDHTFRLTAFIATSIPPFILGLFLLSIFYVGMRWFPPGRTSFIELSLSSSTFRHYTGLLTIDGLLNGRSDITKDAFAHLILPVFSLSLMHWATLGRITRAIIIDEKSKEYITSARARGLSSWRVMGRHALRNVLLPSLTSTTLSIASLLTGVFVIEVIFNLKGVSELVTKGLRNTPDAPLAMGFAVYSVLLVMPLMLILDTVRMFIDPRIRESEGLT